MHFERRTGQDAEGRSPPRVRPAPLRRASGGPHRRGRPRIHDTGWRAAVAAVACCVCLAGTPASAAGDAGEEAVRAPIYDVRAGESLDETNLLTRLLRAHFLLLGEVHDNAEHHEIRARLIAGVAHGGRKPAVALETFDLDREARLRAAQTDRAFDAEKLADAGGLIARHGAGLCTSRSSMRR